jgi:hypothetical protein
MKDQARHPKKIAWLILSQADYTKNALCDLRRPGDHDRFHGGRPMALRHRLSPVLPLSDIILHTHYTSLLHFWNLQNLFITRLENDVK